MIASVRAFTIADDPDAWTAAGFRVDDGVCHLGSIELRFADAGDGVGSDAGTGLSGWTIFHPDHPTGERSVDGLATTLTDEPPIAVDQARVAHPNGTVDIDHVVVATSDIERTTEAFATLDVEARRTRDTTAGGAPLRQRFFRMGTIIELIGPPEPAAEPTPARFWGLSLVSHDLDASAEFLGERLGPVTDAVQAGRRIATLRTRDLGISVPIALMTPHRR